jgi:ribosome modulation factor
MFSTYKRSYSFKWFESHVDGAGEWMQGVWSEAVCGRRREVCPRQSIQQGQSGSEGGQHASQDHHPQQPRKPYSTM